MRGGCFGLAMTVVWLYLLVASIAEGRWLFAGGLVLLLAVLVLIQLARPRGERFR